MKKIILNNGLKVIFKHKECESIYLHLNVKFGSAKEKEGQKGYSHLLEHLIFEGTKKRPNAKLISEEIENLGGELNAATSSENTFYYIKSLYKDYESSIDILSDMIINSTISQKNIEKEKKVVLEEIKMVNDQPRYYQWILLEKALFEGTPYEIPAYGKEEDVKSANREKLVKFYNRNYTPDNSILVIIGNLKKNEKEILSLVKKSFGKWNGKKVADKKIPIPKNLNNKVSVKKDVQQVYYLNSIITPGILDKDFPVIEVIEAILGKPQSGRINDEIRNKRGLAYDVHVSCNTLNHFGFFVINVGCDISNIEEVKKIVKKSYALEELTQEELNTAKSYILGKTMLELENSERQAEDICYWEEITGKDYSKEHLNKIQKVTLKDIKRVLKYFKNQTEVELIPKNS